MPSERSSDLSPTPWRGGTQPAPSNPRGREPGNYILNSLPSLTSWWLSPWLNLLETKESKNQLTLSGQSGLLGERRDYTREKVDGLGKQKLSISSLIHHWTSDILNKLMNGAADMQFPVLYSMFWFFFNLIFSNTFGRSSALGHFGLATGNSNPKTRPINLALSFEK